MNGSDRVMTKLEQSGQHYLFKMKASARVKELINQYHNERRWLPFKEGWEATVQLSSWEKKCRVVLVRRQLKKEHDLALGYPQKGQQQLAFLEAAENIKAYEYAMLVTNMDDEIISIVQYYRDRADCENNFDELKNHWGWGGFTSQQIKSCRLISRMTALVYNW